MASATYPAAGDISPEARAQREAFWRDAIRRAKASGLSRTEFCKQENLSVGSFHFWVGEIRRRDKRGSHPVVSTKRADTAGTSFVPLRVVDRARLEAPPIEIVVGSHTLRLRAGFDPEALRQIIRALEVWTC